VRGAPPEVDRPGQSLNIYMAGRLGQEARRHLQAGLAARPEDHLLPAHDRRDPRREVDHDATGQLNSVPSDGTEQAPPPSAAEPDGKVCMLKPGDPGFADCEACQ
jgi:ribonucleoside-diphosphate reductase alpha chain